LSDKQNSYATGLLHSVFELTGPRIKVEYIMYLKLTALIHTKFYIHIITSLCAWSLCLLVQILLLVFLHFLSLSLPVLFIYKQHIYTFISILQVVFLPSESA